ncbi:hypothetical protein LTR95_003399 [Oleoguttula sp. CCFEE 5521]
MADDLNVLERHLAPRNPDDCSETKRYVRVSSGSDGSVMYRPTPKVRPGWQSTAVPGLIQREIMENVLGSRTTDVIRLYLNAVNPWFPIVDGVSFWKLWHKDPSLISSALLCDIYSIALTYWNDSDALRDTARPDMQFAWNQAVLALRDDCMAPSLTTVHAALLEMLGRPVYHATGNIITAGQTVSLAHSHGLHRDPTSWQTSSAEKSLRIRVWWAVLIHDHWSSLSHGTPPNVTSGQYDVPIPEPGSFVVDDASTREQRAGVVFHQLCRLTAILGEMLPVVYSLRADIQQDWKTIRRIESALDTWEDALPEFLDLSSREIQQGDNERSSTSLWFYYLTLKLLLKRLAFKTTLREKGKSHSVAKQYRFAELYDAAMAIVDFIASLCSGDFRSFWLPYTTYLLVSATTTLLRCTVESHNIEDKKRSALALVRLLHTLRNACVVDEWDLAELCIETCGPSIERVAAVYTVATHFSPLVLPSEQSSASNELADGTLQVRRDTQVPVDDGFWHEMESTWASFLDDTSVPWFDLHSIP